RWGAHSDTIVVIEKYSKVDSKRCRGGTVWKERTTSHTPRTTRRSTLEQSQTPTLSTGSQARQRSRPLPGCSHSPRVRRHWVERFHEIRYQESYGNCEM